MLYLCGAVSLHCGLFLLLFHSYHLFKFLYSTFLPTMKKLLLNVFAATVFVAALIATPRVATAQSTFCGVDLQEAHNIFAMRQATIAEMGEHPVLDRAMRYVPVKIHLVADDAGQGRLTGLNSVLEMLCALNDSYTPFGVRFYIKDGSFDSGINNTAIYSDPKSNPGTIGLLKDPNAINIFAVNNANSPSQPLSQGQVLGYYLSGSSNDFLVFLKSQINGTAGTAPHECGHFFSLSHTFYGWEGTTYTCTTATPNTVGGRATELSDIPNGNAPYGSKGSNGSTAADGFDDTPADYNLGFGWNGCAPYTGCAKDRLGNALVPDNTNFMSYFIGCTNYHFSTKQQNAILSNYNSFGRNFLRTKPAPTNDTISAAATLTYPTAGITTPDYASVAFTWDPTPNATGYLIQVSNTAAFVAIKDEAFVYNTNTFTSTLLQANRNYYWRVRPFNAKHFCTAYTTDHFRTGTVGTSTINEVTEVTLQPNPVEAGTTARLTITTNKAVDAVLTVANLNGQKVSSEKLRLEEGTLGVNIATPNLPAGMYLVSLTTEGGVVSRKLVVQ